jgi:glycosyltransferase involved in cell wall biosynthesis
MPLGILEAMASGLAVVATDIGAIREEVEEGVTGHLIAPGDPGALVRAVRGLLDDPARLTALGDAGRRVAEQHFDAARNYRAIIDLVKKCVDRHARRPLARVGLARCPGAPSGLAGQL